MHQGRLDHFKGKVDEMMAEFDDMLHQLFDDETDSNETQVRVVGDLCDSLLKTKTEMDEIKL
jgi:hypothetical protein